MRNKPIPWGEKDIQIIKNNYPQKTLKQIQPLLKIHRSEDSIRAMVETRDVFWFMPPTFP